MLLLELKLTREEIYLGKRMRKLKGFQALYLVFSEPIEFIQFVHIGSLQPVSNESEEVHDKETPLKCDEVRVRDGLFLTLCFLGEVIRDSRDGREAEEGANNNGVHTVHILAKILPGA